MELTPNLVREVLHYNPDTGIFTHLNRKKYLFRSEQAWRAWNTRYKGVRAGTVQKSGSGYAFRSISLFSRYYSEHRLAWMWMTGSAPPEEIDHKNHDATDNRWLNLRASSRLKNGRNKSKQRNNTSGFTGVSWAERYQKWEANCYLNGKRKYLGRYIEKIDAARAVREFQSANGFDKSHGLKVARYV